MNRPGEPPLAWVRLSPGDAERALRRPRVCKCRTGARNWIEISLDSRRALEEEVRWFGRAYESRSNRGRRSSAMRRRHS